MENDNKIIKIITILLIILIIIIGTIGIYKKNLNKLTNIVPDYTYGMDIAGNREFDLTIDTSENEKTVYVDSEGNIAGEAKTIEKTETENQEESNNYQQIEGYDLRNLTIKANKEENLTMENFEKTRKIIEKRANLLGVEDYRIKLDRQTGKMTLEMAQNDRTDSDFSLLTSEGNLQVVDNQTGLILIENSEIVSAAPLSNQTSAGAYELYLQINFTEKGAEKLKELSSKYIQYTAEGQDEPTTEYIAFEFDGTSIYTTYFGEEWNSNFIYIPISRNIGTQEELKEAYDSAVNLANIINSGRLPVKYSVDENIFIKSAITKENIQVFIYAVYVTVVIVAILFIIKFKVSGFELGIANIGFVALYSLILRYLKITITLSSLIAILSIIFANIVLYYKLLKDNKKFMDKLIDWSLSILPIIIIAIVFTLTKNISTLSIGMVSFWGIVISEIYNFLFVRNFIKE